MSTSFIFSVNHELFFLDVILLSVLKKVSLTLSHNYYQGYRAKSAVKPKFELVNWRGYVEMNKFSN